MAKPCSWYTVYSAKTDEIIASGTADMIVQQMGYASRNSFFSAVCHAKHKKDNPRRRYMALRTSPGLVIFRCFFAVMGSVRLLSKRAHRLPHAPG